MGIEALARPRLLKILRHALPPRQAVSHQKGREFSFSKGNFLPKGEGKGKPFYTKREKLPCGTASHFTPKDDKTLFTIRKFEVGGSHGTGSFKTLKN